MKAKTFLLGLVAVLTVVAVGTTAAATMTQPTGTLLGADGTNTSYTCSSIHYGMNDTTLAGYIATYGTTYTEAKSPYTEDKIIGTVDGITVESFSVTGANAQFLDVGTEYTISKVKYTSDKVHGLKLGTSKNNTTLTYVFEESIMGCDIYAIGWNDDGITISINGSEAVAVPKESTISGNFDDKEITYTKYHFDFTSTHTLEIVTTKRLFIGDITLRIVA